MTINPTAEHGRKHFAENAKGEESLCQTRNNATGVAAGIGMENVHWFANAPLKYASKGKAWVTEFRVSMMEESCSEKHRKKEEATNAKWRRLKKYLGMTLRDASEVNNWTSAMERCQWGTVLKDSRWDRAYLASNKSQPYKNTNQGQSPAGTRVYGNMPALIAVRQSNHAGGHQATSHLARSREWDCFGTDWPVRQWEDTASVRQPTVLAHLLRGKQTSGRTIKRDSRWHYL